MVVSDDVAVDAITEFIINSILQNYCVYLTLQLHDFEPCYIEYESRTHKKMCKFDFTR